jgi:predicted lactoylglutathione lyase
VTTTPQPAQVIVPILTVDDLQKSIAFYEGLGFAVDERWEVQGTLLGVMVRAGAMRLGLNQDDWKKGRDRQKGIGLRLSIATTRAEVDEMARRAKSAGITLESEPRDSEEGRSFELVDPSGFLLTVFSEASR